MIIVVADGLPNAMISGDSKQLTLAISSGLIDFAEAAEITYLDEVKSQITRGEPKGGFTDWIREIDALAGKPCRLGLPSPMRPLQTHEFTQVRTMVQTFLEFIFAHELAHAKSYNANCWAGDTPTDMQRELSCDRFGFQKLATANPPRAMPLFAIPPLIAMSHYERILNRRLGRMYAADTGLPFLDVYEASNWNGRAQALVDLWQAHCSKISKNETTCRDGWKDSVREARKIIALPLPGICVDQPNAGMMENAPVGPSTIARLTQSGALCKGITEMLAAALSQFDAIRGEPEEDVDDSKVWKSVVGLADAADCSVWRTIRGRNYVRCKVARESEPAKTSKLYSATASQIKECVGPRWVFTEDESGKHVHTRTLRGVAASTSHELTLRQNCYPSSGGCDLHLMIE